ncbi:MAG: hypothetical protein Q8L48_07755 [Archangium sp.]|nr:hypothetical protein [Archangium sp.]
MSDEAVFLVKDDQPRRALITGLGSGFLGGLTSFLLGTGGGIAAAIALGAVGLGAVLGGMTTPSRCSRCGKPALPTSERCAKCDGRFALWPNAEPRSRREWNDEGPAGPEGD